MNVQDWTVIVVEDTYDDIQLASAILTYHGVNVKVAINGKECLKLLEDMKPTMIITDLSMPEMDGWEMLTQIPVIAVTAYDSVDVAYDAANAGFDAYIAKPLSPRNFVESLVKVIQ
jgi:CheY-like chemotaxis protein